MQFRRNDALGCCIWHHISLIRYETYRLPSRGRSPLRPSPRSSDLLTHRLSCDTVQRTQGPVTRFAQDYSTRRDALFPGHIHFTIRARDVFIVRKCRDIVVIFGLLSTARLDFYRPASNYFLAGEWHQDTFPSLIHWVFLPLIAETWCTSEYSPLSRPSGLIHILGISQ